MARKKKPPEHVNHERWLVSYADFVTLLFAFFVVLFATNAGEPEKREQLAESVRSAFSSYGIFIGITDAPIIAPPDIGNPSSIMISVHDAFGDGLDGDGDAAATPLEPLNNDDFLNMIHQEPLSEPGREDGESSTDRTGSGLTGGTQVDTVFDDLQQTLAKELADDQIAIRKEKRGIVISLREAGFFDSGSAEIKPSSLEIIDRIARKLRSIHPEGVIRIEGHTDDRPVGRGSRFRDNWELSSARANSVIYYLVENCGFSPQQLVASGYGEWRPAATNDTEAGRARNRRVDIVVMTSEQVEMEATRISQRN